MYLYYVLSETDSLGEKRLEDQYRVELWKPGLSSVVPSGVSLFPFGVWWLFHLFRVFTNSNYRLLLIYDGKRLIHRSCVFPRYFRFPFMEKSDLQIGDTWTDPEYRGKGLASFGLVDSVSKMKDAARRFWYVVEDDNIPSIKVVEKAGFKKVGEGVRTKRLGIGLLGSYKILKTIIGGQGGSSV